MTMNLVRIRERLTFISKLLTTSGVEEMVNHHDRTILLEELEEAELILKEYEDHVNPEPIQAY